METILYIVIAIGVVLVIIGLVSQRKGHRRHSSDGGSDSWDSDSDGGSDSGCSSGCGGGGD
jgi:hypothetical protein